MTNAPTPGWYADPESPGRIRYWDGGRWTEHVAAPAPTQRTVEQSLTNGERIRAAAIDAAVLLPFVALGFVLGPFLGLISGDTDAGQHAYQAAAIVLAVVLGGCVMIWNLFMRPTTFGTDLVARNKFPSDAP